MKKKENLKPNEESVIYFDEKMFNRSVAEMNSLANQAEYPANIWKKIIPILDKGCWAAGKDV